MKKTKLETTEQVEPVTGTHTATPPKYINFTDLFKIKQEGLLEFIDYHGCVFLISKNGPPIKMSLADVS
jgi:hypothetical protein